MLNFYRPFFMPCFGSHFQNGRHLEICHGQVHGPRKERKKEKEEEEEEENNNNNNNKKKKKRSKNNKSPNFVWET